MLELCHQNVASSLEELLVLPVRVDVSQEVGQSVVLPQPEDVVEDEARLLVGSLVPGPEAEWPAQLTLPSTRLLQQRVSIRIVRVCKYSKQQKK